MTFIDHSVAEKHARSKVRIDGYRDYNTPAEDFIASLERATERDLRKQSANWRAGKPLKDEERLRFARAVNNGTTGRADLDGEAARALTPTSKRLPRIRSGRGNEGRQKAKYA